MEPNHRPLTQNEIEIRWVAQLLERRGWTLTASSTGTPTITIALSRPSIPEPRGVLAIERDLY